MISMRRSAAQLSAILLGPAPWTRLPSRRECIGHPCCTLPVAKMVTMSPPRGVCENHARAYPWVCEHVA